MSTAYPVLVNGTANVRSLMLAGGASLTQVGGTLVLAGDLMANGTLPATGAWWLPLAAPGKCWAAPVG